MVLTPIKKSAGRPRSNKNTTKAKASDLEFIEVHNTDTLRILDLTRACMDPGYIINGSKVIKANMKKYCSDCGNSIPWEYLIAEIYRKSKVINEYENHEQCSKCKSYHDRKEMNEVGRIWEEYFCDRCFHNR